MEKSNALSYSSSVMLSNCTQKWVHYKVLKTPKDADVTEDAEALQIGKIFHKVLEDTYHKDVLAANLQEYCQIAGFEEDLMALIHAMAYKYVKLHKQSGLEVIACEAKIETPQFLGYVDVVLKEADGSWWIGDLKTAGRLGDDLLSRLHYDNQLNLYSNFHGMIAEQLKLELEKFKGARYRATTKPRLKRRAGESYQAYVTRLYESVQSVDIIIPLEKMRPAEAWEDFVESFEKTERLRSGVEKPKKNFSYCHNYFRPCEYWSQCYGDTFTALKESLTIKSVGD